MAQTLTATSAQRHDATRSDVNFLSEVLDRGSRAAPRPSPCPTPSATAAAESGELIRELNRPAPARDHVHLSAHCHNDLGLAMANSLAAVLNGARQAECTVNGIGERAGNASLEEVVMTLRHPREYFGVETGIDTTRSPHQPLVAP